MPVLIDDSGHAMNQSLAILEYLEEGYPQPALLPADREAAPECAAWRSAIACEIHPLNNLRVLHYLTGELGIGEEQKNAWYRHRVELGLGQLEQGLARDKSTGDFCHGDRPTFADCCLVPQIFNGKRFGCESSIELAQRDAHLRYLHGTRGVSCGITRTADRRRSVAKKINQLNQPEGDTMKYALTSLALAVSMRRLGWHLPRERQAEPSESDRSCR